MTLKTLYLQRMLSVNGRNALGGRALYDRFHKLSAETLLGHLVYHDSDVAQVTDPRFKSDIVSQALLRDFQPNVIYVEGGLFADSKGMWKIPEDIATEFCEPGGVLIAADVDSNELRQNKAHYRRAAGFFKASASYGSEDSSEPVYGSDERRFWGGHRQILCDPSQMVLSEWLRPIYDKVPAILVGVPVRLAAWESIVASCNADSTSTLQNDEWVDHRDACPFASAAQIGSGFAVLIAGNVSGDAWLEGCPHNPTWLTNLATFLVEAAVSDRQRRTSHRRSEHTMFLSHRSTDKKVVSTIASAIKRGGVNVWLDEEQLVPSQSLVAEITRALDAMTHFVLFWSAACVGAPWVERELSAATAMLLQRRIPFFIVRLDTTPVPAIIADLFRIEALGETEESTGARLVDAVARLARRSSAN